MVLDLVYHDRGVAHGEVLGSGIQGLVNDTLNQVAQTLDKIYSQCIKIVLNCPINHQGVKSVGVFRSYNAYC